MSHLPQYDPLETRLFNDPPDDGRLYELLNSGRKAFWNPHGFVNAKAYGMDASASYQQNTDAFHEAAAALSQDETLILPPGNHNVGNLEWDAPDDSSLMSFGALVGILPGTTLLIGSPTNVYKQRITVKNLKVYRDPAWTAGNTGVELRNCSECDFDIPFVAGYHTGVLCRGTDNRGYQYNHLTGRQFDNNQHGVRLTRDNVGWCNHNRISNISFWTANGLAGPDIVLGNCYLLMLEHHGAVPITNTVIEHCAFEGNVATYAGSIAGVSTSLLYPWVEWVNPLQLHANSWKGFLLAPYVYMDNPALLYNDLTATFGGHWTIIADHLWNMQHDGVVQDPPFIFGNDAAAGTNQIMQLRDRTQERHAFTQDGIYRLNNLINIQTYNGSPNGVVTSPLGSICSDYANGDLYVNTDGGTTWVKQGP